MKKLTIKDLDDNTVIADRVNELMKMAVKQSKQLLSIEKWIADYEERAKKALKGIKDDLGDS